MELPMSYMFVNDLPLLVASRNLARQQKVEMWLDLAQVMRELGLQTVVVIPKEKPETLRYIR